MQPAEILEKAADFLERIGWVQKASYVTDGGGLVVGACMSGACWLAATGLTDQEVVWEDEVKARSVFDEMGTSPNFVDPQSALYTAWQAIVDIKPGGVSWNDARGRTKDEVIDVLKLAAKNLRNEAKPGELS